MQFSGHYDMRVVRNGAVVDRRSFDNVVCTGGLDYIFSCPKYSDGNGYYLGECQVGRGHKAPSSSDTALDAYAQSAPVLNNDYAHPNLKLDTSGDSPAWVCSYQYNFAPGSVVDAITEVGVAPYHPDTTAVNLVSRALVANQFGEVQELIIHTGESLEVIYEFRVIIDPTTLQFQVQAKDNLTPYPLDCKLKAADIGAIPFLGRCMDSDAPTMIASDGNIGSIYESIHGDIVQATYGTYGAYIPGSHTVMGSFYILMDTGNFVGGIKSFLTRGNFHSMQMEVTPAPAKNATKQLRMAFKYNWGVAP